MFRLESYVTPILLDYVSKYVKNIRPEDFQLSLWEGEVALHNLDLRLDVLQEELNLPVEFISGHIHDLNIRVPWTKITSEPIVIVINTIEFVLKLRNPSKDGAGSSASSSPQRLEAKKKRKCPPKTEDRVSNPEASSSWLISKIINNISLQCHNIILKYVEEDIVVSMNVQFLSFESANEKWQNAMIDVHPVKVLMRKLIKITDLTICLDKRNAAGQIDVCQEPILYRSSFECRILLKYNANDPDTNRITRIAVFTNLLDMNISSLQIPLCLRLLKLIVALQGQKIAKATLPDSADDCVDEDEDAPTDQSYLTWAWNLLPSLNFTPGYEDEPTNEEPCHTIDVGFYSEQLSFTLKNAEFVTDTHMTSAKRIRYSPIVRLSIGGMYFEMVSAAARHWTSFKAGVTSICVEPLGNFKIANSNMVESENPHNQRPFIDKSLFDDQCQSIADKGWGVTNYDEYTARITDDYLLYRSPVLAFDLIEYKATPVTPSSGATGIGTTIGGGGGGGKATHDDHHNRVQYRFLTAGLTFRYTQTFEQVKQLICEFINSYDYPAYYTEPLDGGGVQAAGNGTKLPPPIMEDYDALMHHVPLCIKRFSCQRLTIEIHAKGVDTDLSQRQHFRRSFSSSSLKSATSTTSINPPHCLVYIANAECTFSTPLQPDKLVHTTCQLPEKPEKLLEACYENYELHMKEISCSLKNPSEKRNARLIHVPYLKLNYGNLLQPHNWKADTAIDLQKLNLQCDQIFLEFTRRELNSFLCLAHCTFNQRTQALRQLIRLEAPDLTADDNTKLHSYLNKLKLCWQKSFKQNTCNFNMRSLDSHVSFRQQFDVVKQPVFSTAVKKIHSESFKWLECNLLLPCEDKVKNRLNKTIVGMWLGPFTVKVDANILKFLRCRQFEDLERETALESVIQTQVLNLPQIPSNESQHSQPSFVTAILQPSPAQSQPHLVRRASRNSLQTRKVSHPEETIHVSSERDEKFESNTATSQHYHPHHNASTSVQQTDSTPAWLSLIQCYVLCIEVESSSIHIAQNIERDAILTKISIPKIQLKPSNLDATKYATLRQFMNAVNSTKDIKNNVSWTLILSDFGVMHENGNVKEALLEPIQTTVTIALVHKTEKLKTTSTHIKEESEIQDKSTPSPPATQNHVRKDVTTQKPYAVAPSGAVQTSASVAGLQINRQPLLSEGGSSSAGSVTAGGRSERSLTDWISVDNHPHPHIAPEWDGGGPGSVSKSLAKPQKEGRKIRDIYIFNLHIDTTPVRFLVSSRKIRLLEEHLSILYKVVQLIKPTAQPNSCKENHEDPIEIVIATEESNVLKEFMDLETSSNSTKFSDREKDIDSIISFFCQWTITRITLELEANPLNFNSSKILVEFEDLLSAIDQKVDYTKCTSKVGNCSVRYYEANMHGEWTANDSLTIRLLGETTNLPFLNVVYTSVGVKNFFKRIGAKRKGSGDLSRNLTEIIVTIQAIEIMVNLERIGKFVAAVSGFFERCMQQQQQQLDSSVEISESLTQPKTIAAADLPMIHLDSKGFTLYLPLDGGKICTSVTIFRIESIKITPNLENPLQRKPLRPDVYAKAAQLGMLGTPGAIIEDRQYELTLRNISAASGNWHQILAHMSEQRDNFFRTNPAFEWNNQNRKTQLHITEIFSNFSFIAIYAPSIVYQNVLICGPNIEYNCATDFVANFNMFQINMLSCLMTHYQQILCFVQKPKKQKRVLIAAKVSKAEVSHGLNQLLISSMNQTSSTASLQRSASQQMQARDIRSSSIFNSIDERNEQILPTLTTDSGFQSSISQLPSKERFGGSISTLSSVPLTQQISVRRIPQTVSLVAGVFLIKFYKVKLLGEQGNAHADDYDCRMLRIPLFSVTLSQPSFMFTQNVHDSVMNISLYDFYIYLSTTGPSAGAGTNVTSPLSHLVFNEIILDTRPGQANAAGITPPLLSVRTHCTKLQSKECDIELAKPIALLLSEDKIALLCQHVLLINATLLEDPCYEVRPKRNLSRGSKIKLMRQQFFDIDRLHINCRSIVLRFQNETLPVYNCKLALSDMKFNIKFLNRPEKACVKASIGALYLLVDQKAILHPLSMRLSVDFTNEPWHDLPLIACIIKFNMLHVDVGIHSVLHLQAACNGFKRLQSDLTNQWQTFLLNRPFESDHHLDMRNRKLELLKCPPVCDLTSSISLKTSLQREEFYQDDLRAGAFQFVEMYTDTFLPMPYQIQIIKKNYGIICWRYPQPRKMNRIFVYPVPMAMPNPVLIRCRMEYYSEVHENFLHFCDFSLSETVSNQIDLPERQTCANIWRVVILQSLISVNGECFDDFDEESQKSIASIKIDDVLNNERKETDFILHPKVLVGCMRIDTIFESGLVPKIQLLVSCNFLQVKLLNQPNQGAELPTLLKKFKLLQTTQISQAFIIAALQNLTLHAAIISGSNYTVSNSMTCSVKCLDYGYLNMLPILDEATIQSCISVTETRTSGSNTATLEQQHQQRKIDVQVVFERLKLNFGPTIVQTLLASKQHWEEYLQIPHQQHHALVPKCIVVNRTLAFVTFGQTGTSERIQLQNRESCLYSFRSFNHEQALTFLLFDPQTNLTESSQPVRISFKYAGEVLVQPVRIGQKCLFIKSRKLSNMQIYVLIKGQIELMSMVPHDFFLDFRSSDGKNQSNIEYHIEQYERACFNYDVQQTTDISMRLRFAETIDETATKVRTGDIPLRSNKNLPWLVKVPRANDATGSFISFWVRVFREHVPELTTESFKPQKILITIWPIFELYSLLTWPISAEEQTTSALYDLDAAGSGQAIDVPATHLTDHNIKFIFDHAFGADSVSEFALSLKMIDWHQFFWYEEKLWSIEDVLTTLGKGSVTKYPCDDEEEQRVQRSSMTPEMPSIQYNCAPSRELSCTLRLEIAPWGYFINATSIPIALCLDDGETAMPQQHFYVNSNAIQMLPKIDRSFKIEMANATNWLCSSPIFLDETNIQTSTTSKASLSPSSSSSLITASKIGQYYVVSVKSHADIVILRENEVVRFVLSLKIEQQRKVLILRPKFIVANFTKHTLCAVPFAMDHKENARREHLQNLDCTAAKRELPTILSRNDCIGTALDSFHALHIYQSNFTSNTAFVFFVSLKICYESVVSLPISLSLPFTRRCFSAQHGHESFALAATLIDHEGIYYLNIFDDTSPALLIDNQTDVKFIIAQTNASENSKVSSTTPEFMGRHFEWFQLLPPFSSCYYTPPEMYANFPDVDSTICNLALAIYKDNILKKDIKWSKPIRTDKSWEKFLHIPNHGDVKVIICDKHRVVRVSIFYILQQKEFSVKDLRSRLLVNQPTITESDELNVLTTPPTNSPTTIKSKTKAAKGCKHYQINQSTLSSALSASSSKVNNLFSLHAFAKEIILSLHTDGKERDYLKTEIISAYVDDFMLRYVDASDSQISSVNDNDSDDRNLNLLFSNLQIDNQLHATGKYDFPVIICAQELYQKTNCLPQARDLESTYQTLCQRGCMATIDLNFFDDEFSISDLKCCMKPLRAYIEDAYLNELLDALVECAPSNCVYVPKSSTKRIQLNAGQCLLPHDVVAQAQCIAEPLQMRSFSIEPLNILLSVHTSLRLYIALDHSPLSFNTYQRQQILTLPLRFGQSLGMHYLSGAIFGAGWVVGSLEILGSPSCLARSFSIGLRDFLSMPVQGLFRGPWGFIVGITQGSASLLRNVTAGTVNSLTKLAASVARNLDRLSLDREHIERTEAMRRLRPNSLTEGFSQGLTGLGISILGAVGGLAHHTLEARSTVEVVAGVGKGLVGAFTKPISGAAELVALTGQGVLQTVGFNALPSQRMLHNSVAQSAFNEPSAYRVWKLLPSLLSTDQVLFYHEITLTVQHQLHCAYVFLTSTVFAIVVTQYDKLELAYPVNKVVLTRDREDKTLFYVEFTKEDINNEFEDNLSFTNERIWNFLRSSHSVRDSTIMSATSLQDLLQVSINEEQDILPQKHLDWAFYINEHLGEHLIQYLKILRNEI